MNKLDRLRLHGWLLAVFLGSLVTTAGFAAQPGIPIAGRVLDAEGGPLAGATVTLAAEASEYEATKLVLAGNTRPAPLLTVSSDDQGWFSLEAPEAGLWRVTVESRGHVSMRNRLLPLVDVAVLPPVRLVPATTHVVVVKDPAGGAVAGAQVWAAGDQRWNAGRRDGWSPTGRFVLSDQAGKAALPRATDEALQVYAYAPGFALPKRQGAPAGRATTEIVLESGVSFDIVFENPQGDPLVGAAVRLGSGGASAGLLGADGRFRLTMVPDRSLPFDVTTASGQQQGGTFNLSAEALKEIEAGEPQVMRLPEPIVVEGRVVEDSSRRPIPGALVWNPSEARFAVRTDRQGQYRMTLREASRIALQAAAVGYAVNGTEVHAEGPGRSDAPTLVLRPAGSVIGRVVDGEGAPVAGADVRVQPDVGHDFSAIGYQSGSRARSVSLPDGRFYFATLPPKIDWQVIVRAAGFAEARRAVRSGGELEIVLVAPNKARGVVVDTTGVPIAGAQVLLIPVPNEPGVAMGASYDRELWLRDAASYPQDTADEEGRFEITGLAPGPVVLGAKADGFAPTIRETLTIDDLPVTELGRIRLQPAVTLEGVVVDTDDRPVEGAEISWYDGRLGGPAASRMGELLDPAGLRTTTQLDGRFEIDPLTAGATVELSVSAEGFVRERIVGLIAPTEKPSSAADRVRVVIRRGATLAGTVVDGNDDPVGGARLRVGRVDRSIGIGSGQETQHGRTNAEGRFEIGGVRPGTLFVHVQTRERGSARHDGIELGPGERRDDLRLVLDPQVILRGRLTDSQGRMIEGATVLAMANSGADPFAGHASDETDGDGAYRLVLEAPGTFRVSVRQENVMRVEEMLTLEAGDQRHDFLVPSGHKVSGTVLDTDGTPVVGARVTIGGQGQHYAAPRGVRTDEAGRFEIDGVENGTYYLDAHAQLSAPPAAPSTTQSSSRSSAHLDTLVVENEDRSDVVLRLTRGAVVRGRIVGLTDGEREQVRVELMRLGVWGPRAARIESGGTSYRLEHVGPGAWSIMARLPSGRLVSEQIEVADGDQERSLDLVFETGWTATGQVTMNGEPLAGARIAASSSSGSTGSARTDREGRYRLEGLSSGTVHIQVMAADGRMIELRTVELAADIELSFALETISITGQVVTADGVPIAGASVVLVQGQRVHYGSGGQTVTTPNGSFALTATRAGTVVLRVDHLAYAATEHAVEVVRGAGANNVTITLAPAETP